MCRISQLTCYVASKHTVQIEQNLQKVDSWVIKQKFIYVTSCNLICICKHMKKTHLETRSFTNTIKKVWKIEYESKIFIIEFLLLLFTSYVYQSRSNLSKELNHLPQNLEKYMRLYMMIEISISYRIVSYLSI